MSACMNLCLECGALFENPSHITERHGLDTPPFEEQDVCPQCQGLTWCEAFHCECCGEYVTGRYAQIDSGERYCENCFLVREIGDV